MRSVFAIIVTFRRPEMLRTCVAALLGQRAFGLHRIHIVVNSKDQETLDVVGNFSEFDGFITYELRDNPGPAGGFYYGLKRFLSENCDYAWLMDDDIVVRGSCLADLNICASNHEYIFPQVIKSDGGEVVSFGWWGVLLSKALVRRAGLPIKELFYWAEDTEYLQNRLMRVHGTPPFRCKAAVVGHLHQRQIKHPSWYYYYTVRNTLYYRGYIAGYNWYRFKRTLFLFPHSLFMILFKEDNKIAKLRLLIYGTYHGLIGKIGKMVDPETNK